MKNPIRNIASLLLTLFLLVPIAKGQDVPSKVNEAFAEKFPNARQVKWEKESAEEFEAEFTIDGTRMSANFDPRGNWKETEAEISHSDLPKAVQETLKSDYSELRGTHIYKVTQPGKTLYEVEVANDGAEEYEDHEQEEKEEVYEEGKNIHELVFDADGKLVKKEAGEEED